MLIATDVADLKEGAKVLLEENVEVANDAARSTPSTSTLAQRLTILERYLIALVRQSASTGVEKAVPTYKSKVTAANLVTQQTYVVTYYSSIKN